MHLKSLWSGEQKQRFFQKCGKALSKAEGPKICWDACFFILFLNSYELFAGKKGLKNQASL